MHLLKRTTLDDGVYDEHVLFNDGVFEENLGVSEEDVEHAVTDLHARAQHDRYVLHAHLVLLLLSRDEHKTIRSARSSCSAAPVT